MNALNKPTIDSRLIVEAIRNDDQVQLLLAKKIEIYSLATPKLIFKSRKVEVVFDEISQQLLAKIDEMIECRSQQVKDFFLR